MHTGGDTTLTLAPPIGRNRAPWWGLFLFLGCLLTAVLAFTLFQPITVLPRISLAPGYSLLNQAGQPVNSEAARGHLTLYTFSYTHCQTHCPFSAADIAALRAQLAARLSPAVDLQLITLSVDPARDTPADLAAALAAWQTPEAARLKWTWLTGDPVALKYVIGGGFNVYYGPVEAAPQEVSFEPRLVLVDGLGIIRAEYRAQGLEITRLLRDIGYVTEEVQHSQGAARLAYEAAHLFLCYPR